MMKRNSKRWPLCFLRVGAGLLAGALAAGPGQAQYSALAKPNAFVPGDLTPKVSLRECGNFKGHYGPIDYRKAAQRDRELVETAHFEMELNTFLTGQLEGINTSGRGGVVWGFQYTLKSFPNHPAALLVMEQLGRRVKSENPQGIQIPVECWFMRAFMVAPDDPAVRAIYGVYLANRGREAEAIANLKIADAATLNSPALQHQVGTAWLSLKQYELAQLCALRLARRSFPIDTIERQLRDAGKWDPNLSLPAAELAPPGEDPAPAASAPSSKALAPAEAARP